MKKMSYLSLVSIVAPLLYLSMYAPIWNGKELVLYSTFAITLFVFQCVSIILAAIRLCFNMTAKKERLVASSILNCVAVLSVIFTCFVGFIFVLELLNIPWFPAQK